MAIGGIGNGIGGAGGYRPWPARPEQTQASRGPAAKPLVHPDNRAVKESDDAVPATAPPGTDPALWAMLTTEERRFFARLHAAGPLTYGPGSANVPPGLVRGHRIDRTV